MLFCEYPFERPEDAKDRRRFTIVLERVINVQYKIPDGEYARMLRSSMLSDRQGYVSSECCTQVAKTLSPLK